MNALLLAALLATVVGLLVCALAVVLVATCLARFSLGPPSSGSRAGRVRRGHAEERAVTAVGPEQSCWTALDDQQLARWSKDSPQ